MMKEGDFSTLIFSKKVRIENDQGKKVFNTQVTLKKVSIENDKGKL